MIVNEVPIPNDLWATGKPNQNDKQFKQLTIALDPLIEVVDLFCGGGGFSTGAEAAGAKVVCAIDNWDAALKVHHANHPHVPTFNFELGGSIIETAVFIRQHLTPGAHFHLHGSPPCQALSNASSANSEDGMGMVNWFIDLVQHMNPDSWSMENVIPVAKKLDRDHPEVGYVKLNAADFGVAQTRKRVFAGYGWLAEPTHAKEDWVSVLERLPHLVGELSMTTNKNIRQRTVNEPMRSITSKTPSQTRIVSNTDGCNESISRRCQSVDTDLSEPIKTIRNNSPSIRSIHLTSNRGSAESTGRNKDGSKGGGSGALSRSIEDNPSYTVRGSYQAGMVDVEKAVKIRSLTLDETKMLQGFPDDYILPYDRKRDAWVIVGNAVCPPVAEAIIRGIGRGVHR